MILSPLSVLRKCHHDEGDSNIEQERTEEVGGVERGRGRKD
jgi:hypothetical protein